MGDNPPGPPQKIGDVCFGSFEASYSLATNRTCLKRTGTENCVPYVDSRQTQAQLTMDTDLPKNMSAGLQMAYVLNEERQTNRKISQFGVTAFVQLSASVGQLR